MSLSTLPTNRLLSNLSPGTRALLLKHANAVELSIHTVLYEAASVPRYAYFPMSGLASVVTTMPNGDSAEVAFIGREGVIGSLHLLGPASLSTRCLVQMPGSALRVPFADLQQVFDNSEEARKRILEFVQQQAAVVAQVAGCNRIHDAEQRLTRWLLMAQDRTGQDTLDFTHETLSQMIATRRSTVTIVAGDLQRRGLIRYNRGRIHIADRRGLEAVTCVCNRIISRLCRELYQQSATPQNAALISA